uniref:Endonuclease/exonuclease/phosphatase family protein n=1 Tax=Marseillevirus LCMAC201 TaxID=2506605 RepID=A0A481YUZ0_9VIRU|nr:MAG: endonuclease/exonuclease/phosphatase family protein [Marseillevirus LCMAC201]
MILKVVSFNLWSDPFLKNERTEWVYTHIIKEKPDIILFQEVSNSNVLELTKKLRKYNYQYKVVSEGRTVYEMICSKWQITNHKFNRYSTSKTNRGLLWADLRINGSIVTVASTQLDQGTGEIQKRLGQLDCILKSLANLHHTTIIGCDTGFIKENYNLSHWKDAWVSTGKKVPQYTYDSKRNKNITKNIQTRPDRIYYQGGITDPIYELIGTAECCGLLNANPSTHFGICCTFTL